MRIVFLDPCKWDYNPNTPYERPLGGTQSALCYLSLKLALSGHEIYLLNNISKPLHIHGVNCIPLRNTLGEMRNLLNKISPEKIVVLSEVGIAKELRKIINSRVKIYLWTSHAHNQPSFNGLETDEIKGSWDGYIFVGKWQRDHVCNLFNIDQRNTTIIGNAIAPPFENNFEDIQSIINKKYLDFNLAYNSTPFRGLDLLLDIFPFISKEIPQAKLNVYSCLKTYQINIENDENRDLYERCKKMKNVNYYGSLSQPELAKQMKYASVLSYSNTFHETSCISVMEAMSSGCKVITSNIGALPETCANFGTLVNGEPGSKEYKDEYISSILSYYELSRNGFRKDIEEEILDQIKFCRENYTWAKRSKQWIEWLNLNI